MDSFRPATRGRWRGERGAAILSAGGDGLPSTERTDVHTAEDMKSYSPFILPLCPPPSSSLTEEAMHLQIPPPLGVIRHSMKGTLLQKKTPACPPLPGRRTSSPTWRSCCSRRPHQLVRLRHAGSQPHRIEHHVYEAETVYSGVEVAHKSIWWSIPGSRSPPPPPPHWCNPRGSMGSSRSGGGATVFPSPFVD